MNPDLTIPAPESPSLIAEMASDVRDSIIWLGRAIVWLYHAAAPEVVHIVKQIFASLPGIIILQLLPPYLRLISYVVMGALALASSCISKISWLSNRLLRPLGLSVAADLFHISLLIARNATITYPNNLIGGCYFFAYATIIGISTCYMEQNGAFENNF